MRYYRQREWRITGPMDFLGKPLMVSPGAEHVTELLSIDNDYFSKVLKGRMGDFRRVDRCLFYRDPIYPSILSRVRRIIVPKAEVGAVTTVLRGVSNHPAVVAIEDLNGT